MHVTNHFCYEILELKKYIYSGSFHEILMKKSNVPHHGIEFQLETFRGINFENQINFFQVDGKFYF